MKKLCFILLVICQLGYSQSPTVKVFDNEDAKEVSIEKETVLKNAIKWNYSLLTHGEFMINYERELKPWVSFEGGLGLCYKDFIYEGVSTHEEDFNIFDNQEYQIRPGFEARVRFYPHQLDDMGGFYCALGYINRNYAYDTNVSDVVYHSKYGFNEAQFLIGWQYDSYWFRNVMADLYFGVGMRSYTTDLIGYNEDNVLGINHDNGKTPVIYLGYKLTVPF